MTHPGTICGVWGRALELHLLLTSDTSRQQLVSSFEFMSFTALEGKRQQNNGRLTWTLVSGSPWEQAVWCLQGFHSDPSSAPLLVRKELVGDQVSPLQSQACIYPTPCLLPLFGERSGMCHQSLYQLLRGLCQLRWSLTSGKPCTAESTCYMTSWALLLRSQRKKVNWVKFLVFTQLRFPRLSGKEGLEWSFWEVKDSLLVSVRHVTCKVRHFEDPHLR